MKLLRRWYDDGEWRRNVLEPWAVRIMQFYNPEIPDWSELPLYYPAFNQDTFFNSRCVLYDTYAHGHELHYANREAPTQYQFTYPGGPAVGKNSGVWMLLDHGPVTASVHNLKQISQLTVTRRTSRI